MTETHMLRLFLALTTSLLAAALIFALIFFLWRKPRPSEDVGSRDTAERADGKIEEEEEEEEEAAAAEQPGEEDLFIFKGGEDLTISDILDAPGEVVGKSNYGTLYRALLQQGSSTVRLLRFLRPLCAAKPGVFVDAVELLGGIRHPNLVPLLGFYSGPRGEKLLIYPFYRRGNLADFIRDGTHETHRWSTIYRISTGIARGLDHLHTGMLKPVIHGNLKSKNIFLDRHYEPCISDHCLHLLLNPTTGQEMLESSAIEGYGAPELMKMKDATGDTDIYGFGVILLELITGKEPIIIENNVSPSEKLYYLPNYMRNAVLGPRILDLFHPGIFSDSEDGTVMEERVLKLFQVAMACCSPSPSLRPTAKQVLKKIEEMGR